MEYQFARKFNTGVFDVEGSFTYASFFDRDGNTFQPEDFVNPAQLPGGKKLRSHVYAKGIFAPNETWTYGFGVQLSSDDNYLKMTVSDSQHQHLVSKTCVRHLEQMMRVSLALLNRMTANCLSLRQRLSSKNIGRIRLLADA